MTKDRNCKICYCLAPFVGVAVGLFIGFALHFTLKDNQSLTKIDPEIIDFAARLLVFATGIVGVIVGLSYQNKGIYCYAEEADDRLPQEMSMQILLMFAVLLISTALLNSGHVFLYLFLIILFIVSCISKVGWNKYFWLSPPWGTN